jgi:5-methyltetrahydropteroyltriglutamate--homocysteine methyltransferase
MFPDFLDMHVDEMHLEMTTTAFRDIDVVSAIAACGIDAAVGVIDVKSYYIESPEDVAEAVRLALRHAPPERLVFAPDCGLSQTARWAAKGKLANLVAGVGQVRRELGVV